MSCCESQAAKTKYEFIKEKALNFKAFLLKHDPNDEVKEFINKFDEIKLYPTIMTFLVPARALGTSEMMVDELLGKLQNLPDGEREAVKSKIIRYFDMFVELVTS